ncbi:MAG: VOC family protein [Nitrospirae bacterium]|nr:VOC family protein [Nitrospirota bacterium]
MEQRLNIVTLGVSDLSVARAFYEALGWVASSASQDDIVFFQAGGVVLALYPRELLAEDAMVEAKGSGFSGFTLAQNVRSKEDVAQILGFVEAAGGKIIKPAQDAFWGGHSGYFSDPDGNLWEIAWNPHLKIKHNGTLELP